MSKTREQTIAERLAAAGPVTQRELKWLRRRLQTPPAPELHCVPDSMTVEIIHRMERENMKLQADYVENRLKGMEGRAERSFTRAATRGKLKRDFGRKR